MINLFSLTYHSQLHSFTQLHCRHHCLLIHYHSDIHLNPLQNFYLWTGLALWKTRIFLLQGKCRAIIQMTFLLDLYFPSFFYQYHSWSFLKRAILTDLLMSIWGTSWFLRIGQGLYDSQLPWLCARSPFQERHLFCFQCLLGHLIAQNFLSSKALL